MNPSPFGFITWGIIRRLIPPPRLSKDYESQDQHHTWTLRWPHRSVSQELSC